MIIPRVFRSLRRLFRWLRRWWRGEPLEVTEEMYSPFEE